MVSLGQRPRDYWIKQPQRWKRVSWTSWVAPSVLARHFTQFPGAMPQG